MTQLVINQEGAFDQTVRSAVNSNFTQLFSAQFDVVPLTATTTIDSTYAGKIIGLNAAAGLTVTLPAATGSGYQYYFAVLTTVTSNNYIIKVANASDIMGGVATMGSSGGTSASVGTAATSDTITLNGTTTGGIKGTWIELTDIGANLYRVSVHGVASGVAATPFSATV